MYPNIISIEQDINAGSYKKRRHEKESRDAWTRGQNSSKAL